MSFEAFKSAIPDYAKDIKLNLSSVLSAQAGSLSLSAEQIAGIALASAYATKQDDLIAAIKAYADSVLPEQTQSAAKAATSIMAMNNIYYRFLHLVEDKDFSQMPAKLRMNVMANPGVEKVDFELYSLAVSAINGCGLCIESHVKTLVKAGVAKELIQQAIRIAAVINSAAQVAALEAAKS